MDFSDHFRSEGPWGRSNVRVSGPLVARFKTKTNSHFCGVGLKLKESHVFSFCLFSFSGTPIFDTPISSGIHLSNWFDLLVAELLSRTWGGPFRREPDFVDIGGFTKRPAQSFGRRLGLKRQVRRGFGLFPRVASQRAARARAERRGCPADAGAGVAGRDLRLCARRPWPGGWRGGGQEGGGKGRGEERRGRRGEEEEGEGGGKEGGGRGEEGGVCGYGLQVGQAQPVYFEIR